ncbi:hypothetical protein BGZ72_011203 [Mortierella alpina]|nr:hypothetical protein BGZ72_011203 [Mortierella alpina]
MPRGSIAPEQYRDVLDHKREHPDIAPEDLAAWAKNAFHLTRTPRTSTINYILNNAHEPLGARVDPTVLSPLLNKALEYWTIHRQSRALPPMKAEIKEKAQIFAADIGLVQDNPGFAATWWTHFEQLHKLGCDDAKGDFAVSDLERSLLASSEWTDEQLLDLAFEDLERTEDDLGPKSVLDVLASPSSSPQPTPTPLPQEAPSRAQRHFVSRQRKRYPDASHCDIAEYVKTKFGAEYAPSEAMVANILGEAPNAAMQVPPKVDNLNGLARLTDVHRARIYQYAQCNAGFSYSAIATWAHHELGFHRRLTAAEVEGVINTFQSDSRRVREKSPRNLIPPLTTIQRRRLLKKREKNLSPSAMALMCWAQSEFRVPGAPSAAGFLDILSNCDGESVIRSGSTAPRPKIPRKNNRSHGGHERVKGHRSTPQSPWNKKDSSLPRPRRSSDVHRVRELIQHRQVPFQDTTLYGPGVDPQTRSWLFSIPSLGVIGCLTSEALHYQRMPSLAGGSSDGSAEHDEENPRTRRRAKIETHYGADGYEVVSDVDGDEADDENDDAYGGYYDGTHITLDGRVVEQKNRSARTCGAFQKSSIVEEPASLEDSDCSESQHQIEPAVDWSGIAHCKEDQAEGDRQEDDIYMDMDVEEASCILSAMGICKEVENSIVKGDMGPSPAQSWSPEQQSISLQVVLTTLDPDDLTQRSAYVVLLDMSRRITTVDQGECYQEHLRAFSQRWSQEEKLQSLFTVATLLDMQNPFHFAAYVVLTNTYNKIKNFE